MNKTPNDMRNNILQYADQGVFHKEDFEESTLSAQIFLLESLTIGQSLFFSSFYNSTENNGIEYKYM